MDHSGDEMEIDNVGEITRFFQRIKAFHLQQLSYNFVGGLIAPFVDIRQVNIVDKNGQLFASRRAISVAHSLIHAAFDSSL